MKRRSPMTSDKDKSMRGGTQTGSSAQTGPYRGRIGDLDLLFATEEDFRKADRVFREFTSHAAKSSSETGVEGPQNDSFRQRLQLDENRVTMFLGIQSAKPAKPRTRRYPTRFLVPILRELGFRVAQVYVDCIDLLVEGVRELRRLQMVAHDISVLGILRCELEIVTDQIPEQKVEQWRGGVWVGLGKRKVTGAMGYQVADAPVRSGGGNKCRRNAPHEV